MFLPFSLELQVPEDEIYRSYAHTIVHHVHVNCVVIFQSFVYILFGPCAKSVSHRISIILF